jgi:hypothetical protein
MWDWGSRIGESFTTDNTEDTDKKFAMWDCGMGICDWGLGIDRKSFNTENTDRKFAMWDFGLWIG